MSDTANNGSDRSGVMNEKYVAEPRGFEDKDYLYEQYWGDFRTSADIAADHEVSGTKIRRVMDSFGIPRRTAALVQHKRPYDVLDEWRLPTESTDGQLAHFNYEDEQRENEEDVEWTKIA